MKRSALGILASQLEQSKVRHRYLIFDDVIDYAVSTLAATGSYVETPSTCDSVCDGQSALYIRPQVIPLQLLVNTDFGHPSLPSAYLFKEVRDHFFDDISFIRGLFLEQTAYVIYSGKLLDDCVREMAET